MCDTYDEKGDKKQALKYGEEACKILKSLVGVSGLEYLQATDLVNRIKKGTKSSTRATSLKEKEVRILRISKKKRNTNNTKTLIEWLFSL
jgi:hypothetical protein